MGMKKRLVRAAARAVTRQVTTRDLRTAALLAASRWAGRRLDARLNGKLAPDSLRRKALRRALRVPGPDVAPRGAGGGPAVRPERSIGALVGSGLAGMALALPLGWWIGRRRRGDD